MTGFPTRPQATGWSPPAGLDTALADLAAADHDALPTAAVQVGA